MPIARTKEIITAPYLRLVASIRRQVAYSRSVIERTTVVTYWSVGRAMQAFLKNDPQRGADVALARRLSEDIKIDVRTLQQALQFYRAYPKLDREMPLSWSHYRVLMTVDAPKKRLYWAKRAVRDKLGIARLRELVREASTPQPDGTAGTLPAPVRGKLYHYRLVKVDYVSDAPGGIMVDCGFASRIVPPPSPAALVNKRIVRAVKEDGAYSLAVTDATVDKIYAYKALVERVVDGDTLLTNIDVGFGLWTRQYLRLKGIDAPELRAAGGIRARDWVVRAFARCPFIIVKTHKSGKFDRYLSDVFYFPKVTDVNIVAAKGAYLNQQLLDEGLAKIWKGPQ